MPPPNMICPNCSGAGCEICGGTGQVAPIGQGEFLRPWLPSEPQNPLYARYNRGAQFTAGGAPRFPGGGVPAGPNAPNAVPPGQPGQPGAPGLPGNALVAVYFPQQFTTINGSQQYAVPQVSTLLISTYGAPRSLLIIRNSSAVAGANIFINFGAAADAASAVRLAPNEVWMWDDVVPQDEIYGFADAATGFASIMLGTFIAPF